MLSENTIKPNEGYGKIKFGMDMDELAKLVGEPEEIVSFDDDEELNIVVLHYWEQGFSVFMDGNTSQVVAGIETDNPDAELYGTKIIGMPEDKVVEFMKKHGHNNFDIDMEDADKRYSFDEGMMDFFFVEGKLEYMNFGVLVDEEGNVETV
ncbi:MAG: hypothetical protein C0598_07850 [Marinilabiliales bacterium]|nr:MAG: hypothetical protein C0598_07850 [Marinilabiliales bacterium]